MSKRYAGLANQSIPFALKKAGLTIANLKSGYILFNDGDGTSWSEVLSGALTELATITTAHTDDFAKFLDADATGGNKFNIRVDFPDAAFPITADRVICNVYDDTDEVVAHREFDLIPQIDRYPDGAIYFDSGATANTGTILGKDGTKDNPVTNASAARTLAIALAPGSEIIKVAGNFLAGSLDMSGMSLQGIAPGDTFTTASTTGMAFTKLTDLDIAISQIEGWSDNDIPTFRRCTMTDNIPQGFIAHDSLLQNTLSPVQNVELHNCRSGASDLTFDATSGNLITTNFIGDIVLQNGDSTGHHVDIIGKFTAEVSVTNTSVVISGKGITVDNGGSGFAFVEVGWIETPIFDNLKTDHVVANSFGKIIQDLETNLAIVDQNVDDIEIDTGVTIPALIGTPNFTDLVGDIANLITRLKGLNEIHDDLALVATDVLNIESKVDIIDGIVDDILLDTAVIGTPNFTTVVGDIANLITRIKGLDDIHDDVVVVDTVVDLILVDTGNIKTKTDNLPEAIKKFTAVTKFPFGLVQSSDNISPATGISVTAKRSIDGGAFVTMTNSVTELSDGDYFIDLSAADTNGTFITYKFNGSGARTKKIRFKTAV